MHTSLLPMPRRSSCGHDYTAHITISSRCLNGERTPVKRLTRIGRKFDSPPPHQFTCRFNINLQVTHLRQFKIVLLPAQHRRINEVGVLSALVAIFFQYR